MDAAKRQKVMDRIRKMIALSTDQSTTEGERIAARHQAKKLMEEYCISHLEDPEVQDKSVIEEKYVPYQGMIINRDLFEVLPYILHPIAAYFGCFVIIHHHHDGIRYETFCGFRPNVEMVQYAANVVLRQGIEEARREYRKHRSITFLKSFWTGFALGIEQKFKIDEQPSERGLILYDQVKSYVDEVTGDKKSNMELDLSRPDYITAGKEFGRNVTVHSALGTSGTKGNLLG